VARHPQIASIFDTMVAQKKVRYLKIDRGRYLYQRRIPIDLQAILDAKVWSKPCGDVSYSKAVQLVVTWAPSVSGKLSGALILYSFEEGVIG
jgi:hypothetical protein